MATEALIQQHTEEIEYIREIAKREVAEILNSADVREITQNPGAFVDRVLAAALLIIAPYSLKTSTHASRYAVNLGLSDPSDRDVQSVDAQAQARFLTAARPILIAALIPITQRLNAAIFAGVNPHVLQAALQSDATKDAMLAGFESALRQATVSYLRDVERSVIALAIDLLSAASGQPATGNFEWLTVMDSATCDSLIENSCAPRHGIVLTLDQWTELGRPGAPQLLCSIFAKAGSYCRCVLEPSGKVGEPKLLNPVSVTSAIRAARERAMVLR